MTPYTQSDLDGLHTMSALLTPEEAASLRRSAKFERQRPVNAHHVGELAETMRRGWFVAGTPLYIGVLPDGTEVLLNGNHTCEAIVKAGVPVLVSIIYNNIPDMAEANRIYMNLDTQRRRSWEDALQASEGDRSQFKAKALAAVGFLMSGFNSAIAVQLNSDPMFRSRDARFALFQEFSEPIARLQVAVTASAAKKGSTVVPRPSARYITRAAVLAVAIVTMRDQPETATQFWSGMAEDDGLRVGDPRKTLINWLQSTAGLSQGVRTRINQAVGTSAAWNAYFQGRDLTVIKVNAIQNFRLLGTEFHRGPRQPVMTEAPETAPAKRPAAPGGLDLSAPA